MTTDLRNLLISLSAHMAYMQGQLEARHELDDPEDFYWYRESVLLRQKVTDALAEEPAVPEGREPAAVAGEPSDEELTQHLFEGFRGPIEFLCDAEEDAHLMIRSHVKFARAVLARWGRPTPAAGEVGDDGIPLGPFSEHDLRQQWDQQADEFNQWDSLDLCEQLAWAQARATAADRARYGRPASAPAEGGVGQLSDAELESFLVDVAAQHGDIYWAEPLVLARAVLARWGNPVPAPPADGEVADLVAEAKYLVRELCDQADDLNPSHELFGLMNQAAASLARAAELLQRQAPVPVSVSERLPGVEDCDAEGRC